MIGSKKIICIAWAGLTRYAADCVKAFVCETDATVIVVSLRPYASYNDLENHAGTTVIWVEINETNTLEKLIGRKPDFFVQAGWAFPTFNRWGKECKSNGGHVICLLDNNFYISIGQVLKTLRFRLQLRRKYDRFLVPGESSRRLLKFYGVPDFLIRKGMYAASSEVFKCERSICDRPKRFLFVGQFVERKNIILLCMAFIKLANEIPDWELWLCGDGVLRDKLPKHEKIKVVGFVQPENLKQFYNYSRCFILPSHNEHWGVVVHEAALCGCLLILSRTVGSSIDFAGKMNSFKFSSRSIDELVDAMKRIVHLTPDELEYGQQESLRLAKQFSPLTFAKNLIDLLSDDSNT